MLLLRVFGDSATIGGVAEQAARRTRRCNPHVSVTDAAGEGDALVTADVGAASADRALELVRGLGIPAADVSLLAAPGRNRSGRHCR